MGFTVNNEIVPPYSSTPLVAGYVVLGDVMASVLRQNDNNYLITSSFYVYHDKQSYKQKKAYIERIVVEVTADSYPIRPERYTYLKMKERYTTANIVDDADANNVSGLVKELNVIETNVLSMDQKESLKTALTDLNALLI